MYYYKNNDTKPARMTMYERERRRNRKFLAYLLGGLALLLLTFVGVIAYPEEPVKQEGTGTASAQTQAPVEAAPPTPKQLPPTTTPTKEFSFVAQGGQEVTAITKATADAGDKHIVVFTPLLEKTDGNLYLASLQSLWKVYGKHRGLFQLQDAQMRESASLGGNAICWRIANPNAEFCIFPTKDSESGRIAALTVWVQ